MFSHDAPLSRMPLIYIKTYVAPDQKLIISLRIALSIMHVQTALMFLILVNYRNTPVNELGGKIMALVKQGTLDKKDSRF